MSTSTLQTPSSPQSGLFNSRVLLACALGSAGLFLAALGFASNPLGEISPASVGSWSVFPAPPTSPTQDNYLVQLSCTSAANCWAVGHYVSDDGSTIGTHIELWNGSSWSIVPSANVSGAQANYLWGVACVSASDCWAVGYYVVSFISGGGGMLIEHWDGNSWTIVTPSDSNITNAGLFGVTCASTSDCWAVGTVIEHWNGTVWVLTPNIDDTTGRISSFYDVTCISASDCWAVGFYYNPPETAVHTLTEHWNGMLWSTVRSPDGNSTFQNFLSHVACASASDCWAVGSYRPVFGSTPAEQTLIDHWDGTSWTRVSSPDSSSTEVNRLQGVACASASECWATGVYVTDETTAETKDHTLIEQWNGTSWSIVPSPESSSWRHSALYGVVCASASECWAVGYYNVICPNCQVVNNVSQNLVERFAIPIPLNGVVSRQVHGNAGTFDLNLPLIGTPGIECRSGSTNGDFTLVFTFANTLASVSSAAVASGTGSVSSSNIDSNDAHNYIVNLTGVTNAQTITVSLSNATDSVGSFSSAVSASMSVLLGDVNASGRVDSGDVSLVRQQTLQPVTGSNFREDINASGRIDSGDVSIVRQQTLTSLP